MPQLRLPKSLYAHAQVVERSRVFSAKTNLTPFPPNGFSAYLACMHGDIPVYMYVHLKPEVAGVARKEVSPHGIYK